MLKVIFLGLLLCQSVGSVAAQVYTCRDADGRLYAGDNLQALPESCRQQVTKLPDGPADNLNYVPRQKQPSAAGHEFRREVSRAQQAIDQREKMEENLLKRARAVAAEYRKTEQQKWAARKDLTTRSRASYDEALKKQQELIGEKRDILDQMDRARLSSASRKQILKDLEQVKDVSLKR